jgi:hypothetical protein
MDARNALSCAIMWGAIVKSLRSGKLLRNWDELAVMVNAFGQKVEAYMTEEGKKELRTRNLATGVTEKGDNRRTLKIGLSKFFLPIVDFPSSFPLIFMITTYPIVRLRAMTNRTQRTLGGIAQ